MIEHITTKVEQRGMVVYDSKTGVMCVSDVTSFKFGVKLRGRNYDIHGSDSLKFLGVTLNNDCFFNTHAKNVRAKLISRTWT